MSKNSKHPVVNHALPQQDSTPERTHVPLLAPEEEPRTSEKAPQRKRRVEAGIGIAVLAGVLYLPFSPLFSFHDSSDARLAAADTAAPSPALVTFPVTSAETLGDPTSGSKLIRPTLAPVNPNTTFEDVPEDSTYYAGVQWALRSHIMTPESDTYFGADETVTRGDLIAMFYHLAGTPTVNRPEHSPYLDVDDSDPNYDAYLWARDQKITSGWADGKFHPESPLSTASAAALLHRADGAPKIRLTGTSPFSDVTSMTPFYRQIVWASRRGVSTVSEGDAFGPLQRISKARTAQMLYLYFRTMEPPH